MRDKHIGKPHIVLQIHQQVQNLRLNQHVERRNRLVAHDKLRIKRKGAGNADTLATAAVKLVRVRVGKASGKADNVHQL